MIESIQLFASVPVPCAEVAVGSLFHTKSMMSMNCFDLWCLDCPGVSKFHFANWWIDHLSPDFNFFAGVDLTPMETAAMDREQADHWTDTNCRAQWAKSEHICVVIYVWLRRALNSAAKSEAPSSPANVSTAIKPQLLGSMISPAKQLMQPLHWLSQV